MNIIIVGAGTVGFGLAEHFSSLNHHIAVIDRDLALCEHINGKLDEPCWQSAPSHWLDSGLRSGKPPQESTEFKVLYDENNMYVGATLDCADTSKLRANIKQDGSDVWQDDCLEFLFNPNNDMTTLVHLMVNGLGTRGAIRRAYDKVKDSYVIDSNWSPAWTVRCALEPTKWHVEAAVLLSELDELSCRFRL